MNLICHLILATCSKYRHCYCIVFVCVYIVHFSVACSCQCNKQQLCSVRYELCFFYSNALNWIEIGKKSHFEKWKTRKGGKRTHIQTEHDNNNREERRVFRQKYTWLISEKCTKRNGHRDFQMFFNKTVCRVKVPDARWISQ